MFFVAMASVRREVSELRVKYGSGVVCKHVYLNRFQFCVFALV